MSQAIQLTGGGDQSKRRDLDFYPTPEDVTTALLQFLNLPPIRIWEPACGDGAMSKVLQCAGHSVTSSDIRETGFGDGSVDFLTAECVGMDAIITNPPFAASEDFIRRAIGSTPLVAMVLKTQYWHAKKRTELFLKHPPAWILPLTWRPDFMGGERGGAPTMEVHWTVWVAGDNNTKYRLLKRPTKQELAK